MYSITHQDCGSVTNCSCKRWIEWASLVSLNQRVAEFSFCTPSTPPSTYSTRESRPGMCRKIHREMQVNYETSVTFFGYSVPQWGSPRPAQL